MRIKVKKLQTRIINKKTPHKFNENPLNLKLSEVQQYSPVVIIKKIYKVIIIIGFITTL